MAHFNIPSNGEHQLMAKGGVTQRATEYASRRSMRDSASRCLLMLAVARNIEVDRCSFTLEATFLYTGLQIPTYRFLYAHWHS